ncbi:uncharacterized protein LOC128952359 [Oppia nitens]|uniref:uncharacterized protein LOC128952359 n=1 Tax=Oppia nitens TaxID=1686743 RepID=UPI0023DA52C8|nr:uncharacterized protein LOC128952359 [Oppia nitens]
MNQINDNIRQSRLGRHKKQDMSVTIDVNDVFEEVVKQNERLVKEIEFYEEVVNDLLTNLKTCVVCQQNDVIKDRISELETRNTKERLVVKDVTHINSSEPTDETLNYAKPIHDLKGDNNCQQISSSCNYESDDNQLPELISDAKPYSLEYEAQRDALRDKTHLSGVGSGYRCQSCDFQNYKFRVLEKHINRFHLNIKPFKCRVCCIGFYCLSDCIQHLRRRHNIVSDKINDYKVIDETVNEYKPYSDDYVEQLRALKASSRRSDGRYHCNDWIS